MNLYFTSVPEKMLIPNSGFGLRIPRQAGDAPWGSRFFRKSLKNQGLGEISLPTRDWSLACWSFIKYLSE